MDSDSASPVTGAAFGMSYSNNKNLVLRIEEYDEVRKFLEEDSPGAV